MLFLVTAEINFLGGGGDREVFLFLTYSSRNKYMYLIAKVISFSISFLIYIYTKITIFAFACTSVCWLPCVTKNILTKHIYVSRQCVMPGAFEVGV